MGVANWVHLTSRGFRILSEPTGYQARVGVPGVINLTSFLEGCCGLANASQHTSENQQIRAQITNKGRSRVQALGTSCMGESFSLPGAIFDESCSGFPAVLDLWIYWAGLVSVCAGGIWLGFRCRPLPLMNSHALADARAILSVDVDQSWVD